MCCLPWNNMHQCAVHSTKSQPLTVEKKQYPVTIFFEFDARTQKGEKKKWLAWQQISTPCCLSSANTLPNSQHTGYSCTQPILTAHSCLAWATASGRCFGAEPTQSQQAAAIRSTHCSTSPRPSSPRTREKCLVQLPLTQESSVRYTTAVRIQFPDVTALGDLFCLGLFFNSS